MDNKIQNFTDLDVWKQGHNLVLLVYRLTKKFPREELFGITNQMRRCVVSITSNVAEGFSRQTRKEKVQFYSISVGSLTELKNQLIISRDLGYLSNEEYRSCTELLTSTHRLLNGLIRKIRQSP